MTNRGNNVRVECNKPIISVEKQKELLVSRWLIINDSDQIDWYLKNVWYYRLSIYRKALEESDDQFREWTTFSQISQLYEFDKKLRLLVLPYLEMLENAIKTIMIRQIWEELWWVNWSFRHQNSLCYRDPVKWISTISWICNKNKDHICIKHYYDTYKKPIHPPIRMILQVASYWETSRLLSTLEVKYQKLVAREFWIPHFYFRNWVYCLLQLRNKAAHYDRLWNRKFTGILRIDHRDYVVLFQHIQEWFREQSLFSYLLVLIILWGNIESSFSNLEQRIWNLLTEYHWVDISKMWFPENWQQVLQEVLAV